MCRGTGLGDGDLDHDGVHSREYECARSHSRVRCFGGDGVLDRTLGLLTLLFFFLVVLGLSADLLRLRFL